MRADDPTAGVYFRRPSWAEVHGRAARDARRRLLGAVVSARSIPGRSRRWAPPASVCDARDRRGLRRRRRDRRGRRRNLSGRARRRRSRTGVALSLLADRGPGRHAAARRAPRPDGDLRARADRRRRRQHAHRGERGRERAARARDRRRGTAGRSAAVHPRRPLPLPATPAGLRGAPGRGPARAPRRRAAGERRRDRAGAAGDRHRRDRPRRPPSNSTPCARRCAGASPWSAAAPAPARPRSCSRSCARCCASALRPRRWRWPRRRERPPIAWRRRSRPACSGWRRSPRPTTELERQRCPPAQTLHRLLGWSPRRGTFAHHQNNRLAQKVIIVDESSMIDLSLMERLVRAVADDARLVLLGDADQLPSIEAGAVFRDLSPLAHRLTRSHRVDTRRARRAAARRAGARAARRRRPGGRAGSRGRADLRRRRAGAPRSSARRCSSAGTPGSSPSTTGSPRPPATPTGPARTAISRRRIASSSTACTRTCIARASCASPTAGPPARWRSTTGCTGATAATPARSRAGEPVMVLRNDYQRGLYNGDQGIVILLRRGRRPRPASGGGLSHARRLAGMGHRRHRRRARAVVRDDRAQVAGLRARRRDPAPARRPHPDPHARAALHRGHASAPRRRDLRAQTAILAAGAAAPLVRSSGLAERLG